MKTGYLHANGLLDSDAGRALGDYASTVDFDPARLEDVRSRLDRIFRLKRKYGPALEDVLQTAQRVRAELDADWLRA